MVLVALAGGSLILVVVLVIMVVAIAYGYYTYRGSGINAHPHDGRDQAPGASGPSDAAGRGRLPDDPEYSGDEGSISTHGTK
jgi:hypothetical protein